MWLLRTTCYCNHSWGQDVCCRLMIQILCPMKSIQSWHGRTPQKDSWMLPVYTPMNGHEGLGRCSMHLPGLSLMLEWWGLPSFPLLFCGSRFSAGLRRFCHSFRMSYKDNWIASTSIWWSHLGLKSQFKLFNKLALCSFRALFPCTTHRRVQLSVMQMTVLF